MILTEPSLEYEKQIASYRKEFLDCESSMDGTGELRKTDDPKVWIRRSGLYKAPDAVPEGLVQATQYRFVREEDRKIVGMIQIRHYLNDYLAQYAGHIGYSVAPSERRKGYATKMLKTVLPICGKLGLGSVLITCNVGNEGSKKVILNNGGKYDSTVYEPDEGKYVERYWIDLSSCK